MVTISAIRQPRVLRVLPPLMLRNAVATYASPRIDCAPRHYIENKVFCVRYFCNYMHTRVWQSPRFNFFILQLSVCAEVYALKAPRGAVQKHSKKKKRTMFFFSLLANKKIDQFRPLPRMRY
ncbi:hypothetical protein, unlikely [Trypanosoma brucei gambiense DAL972]|uniref:Uncharacterized protein n=1 Tax=Trypanosoma brucei gambiense (strain MHOM/CI/86/DAL972) TaxID=679716 RepID=C9ZVS6_TRYB9|nr:hypothetical protein, unlikely [Trypanosoma brucei gambiense DAL972]CBH13514.1 hypothetical protein, unlikely [Trypanosoma brucei gambiense DAL972]|eukprot:XP_011775791.1 hypothetical protein, unlikely [Trypanosoma brucei gambiense DAL972]